MQYAPIALKATALRSLQLSPRWTKGQSCTNNRGGRLIRGCSEGQTHILGNAGTSVFTQKLTMMNLVKRLLLVIAICTPAVSLGAQDFDKGFDAYVSGDYSRALEEWLPLAEAAHADAQNNLGIMYSQGRGVVQDYEEAARWFRMAADHGSHLAQFNLGQMLAEGRGVGLDYEEAARLHQMAAENGVVLAQLSLGYMYEFGQGVQLDLTEAHRWYRAAAEQGNATAQLNLGILYNQGRGVLRDPNEAFKWLRSAAEQGKSKAQYNLGIFYEFGGSVPVDNQLAHMWYNLAGANGYQQAVGGRDRVADAMTQSELQAAQRRARICLESNYQECD